MSRARDHLAKVQWEVDHRPHAQRDEGIIYVQESEGHGRVCRLWDDREHRNVNARLIAAAPEMLRALQRKGIETELITWILEGQPSARCTDCGAHCDADGARCSECGQSY